MPIEKLSDLLAGLRPAETDGGHKDRKSYAPHLAC